MFADFIDAKDSKTQCSCLPHFILLVVYVDNFNVYFLIVTYSPIIFEIIFHYPL